MIKPYIIKFLLLISTTSYALAQSIPDLGECNVEITKSNLAGNWIFTNRGSDRKLFDTSDYPQIIRYSYFENGTYILFNKKILENEEFHHLPLNEWIKMESGNWNLDLATGLVTHENKKYSALNRRKNPNHSYRIKQLCTAYYVAEAYLYPKNNREKRTLNYMKRCDAPCEN